MQSDSGATASIWMETSDVPTFAPLVEDTRASVCIVGAGIAGLTTAYLLTRAGKTVVVVDDGPIGGGDTSRTTAHLTAVLDDRYYEIARLHGDDGARYAAESHTAAIQRIEAIAALEDIDCDFERVDGFLMLADGESEETLHHELDAAHQASLSDVALFQRGPIDTFDTGPVLRFPRQAQFHPLQYLAGLAKAIVRDGGKIYCRTKVTGVEDGEPATVTTADGYTILSDDVVVATHSPMNDWMVIHTKQASYRTYAIGLKISKGILPHLLLWDTADPYHYVRLQQSDDPNSTDEVLIVGGEDHKTGQADDTNERFQRLERWARQRFPKTGDVVYRWSGQVMEPVDTVAYIGKNPGGDKHIYIITGQSGNGMTYSTIGGILITDLIQGRENPWSTLYNPSRITLRSAPEFARENLNVAEQYGQYLTGGDVSSIEDITPGTGAVIRRGIHKVAVYKDQDGKVTERSAVCPHLYCIVDWNDTEKSWDCPCHGSRFDCHGKVVNGPAVSDLAEVASVSKVSASS